MSDSLLYDYTTLPRSAPAPDLVHDRLAHTPQLHRRVPTTD